MPLPQANMPGTPSMLSVVAFLVIVAGVAALVLSAFRRSRLGATAAAVLLLAYLAVPGLLARSGALDRYAPLPAPALVLVLALSAGTIWLTLSRWGTALITAVPMAAVVALQAFRIPVEWVLHRLYAEGVIPVEMSYSGLNFDIVSGVSGLLLGAWLLSGRKAPRGLVLAWNIMGLLLLTNIVAIAVLSTPVPFRRFVDGPANLLPSTFPFVWLPSFLVQVALGSHLLVFRALTRRGE